MPSLFRANLTFSFKHFKLCSAAYMALAQCGRTERSSTFYLLFCFSFKLTVHLKVCVLLKYLLHYLNRLSAEGILKPTLRQRPDVKRYRSLRGSLIGGQSKFQLYNFAHLSFKNHFSFWLDVFFISFRFEEYSFRLRSESEFGLGSPGWLDR